MKWFLLLSIFLFQAEIPSKPNDEFSLEIKYTFEERTASNSNAVEFSGNGELKNKSTGPLPFLALKFKVLKAAEGEVRVKAVNNNRKILFSRKIQLNEQLVIDMGFMTDIKDRVEGSTYEVTISTLSANKEELKRIHVIVLEDGAFMVNGEKRGKF